MAILKNKVLSSMGINELQNKLNDLRLELLKANAQKSGKTSPRKIKEIKKTIARILTTIKKSPNKDSDEKAKSNGLSKVKKTKIAKNKK